MYYYFTRVSKYRHLYLNKFIAKVKFNLLDPTTCFKVYF